MLQIVLTSCQGKQSDSKIQKPIETVNPDIYGLDDTLSISKNISFKVDTFFNNRYKSCQLSGAYLIAKENKIHTGTIGSVAQLQSSKIKSQDVFQLASVSKVITSLIIQKLSEDRKLNLEDTITKYFEFFSYPNITIKHLLTHTSGLPEYTYLTDTAWGEDTIYKKNTEALRLLSNSGQEAYFSPGSRFDYCNSNYMILAAIAEKIEQAPFAQIVKYLIKEPLNLPTLHVYNPNQKISSEYRINGMRGNHREVKPHLLDGIVGDKSIYASVYDLYLLSQNLMANNIINANTLKEMMKPHVRVKNNQFYGYGIRMTTLDNGEIWHYHNGWWHGFRSYFWINMKTKETIVILTNRLKCGFLNPKDIIWLMNQ